MLLPARIGQILLTSLAPARHGRVVKGAVSFAQQRLLSDQARALINSAVKNHPVVLFMKGTPDVPQCGFSRAVIQVLDLHDVPPEKLQTYNVLADSELRTGIKEYSDWPTIPQLYINGEFVGGCDIVMSMHQSGELEALLKKLDDKPSTSGRV